MEEDSEDTPFIGNLNTSDSELETFHKGHKKRRRLLCLACCGIIIVIAFLIVLGAAFGIGYWVWSTNSHSKAATPSVKDEICANPPVLQISIDGYWAGYYHRDLSPNLRFLAENGVRAEYLRSQYPTKTFPNHFSIVTGLFPEYHGIVDNTFTDRHLNETFHVRNKDQTDSKWWLGEPVWITAEKQGLTAGIYFWPGSETEFEGLRPRYYFNYNGSVPFEQRVETILSWFDLPKESRPQYMAMYFSEPDHSGHNYGPDSPQVNESLVEVDNNLGVLITGLKQRQILDCVNIIITSDHGMAFIPKDNVVSMKEDIYFYGVFITNDYRGRACCYMNCLPDPKKDFPAGVVPLLRGTSVSLNIHPPANKGEVYEMFKYPNGSTFHPSVEVYYQWEAPVRFHVGQNLKWRYGDILFVPKVGWMIGFRIPGNHGFDNNVEEMQALFVAHGPAFQKGIVVPAFDNIEIYNLVCALLKIKPSGNNGTFGSLYHMLDAALVSKLPPAETHKPLPERNEICHFPPTLEQFIDLANISCTNSDCSIDHQTRLNATSGLNLSSDAISMLEKQILPWGTPSGGGGEMGSCLLVNQHFVTKYSLGLHIPLWSAYVVDGNRSQESEEQSPVTDCFSHDPRVDLSHSSNCSNYDGTFEEGQLAPPNSLPGDARELTFLLSNAVPQHPIYRQEIGSYLESKIHLWANMASKIYVISGVVLDADNDGHRDSDTSYSSWTQEHGSVAVPSHFYTIVTSCNNSIITNITKCPSDNLKIVAFLTINTNTVIPEGHKDGYLQERLTTIREVETITGINFFPNLSVASQNNIEMRIVPTLNF